MSLDPKRSLSNRANFIKISAGVVEVTFCISYTDNMKVDSDTLVELMNSDERILKEEGNVVAVVNLNYSSVDILYRAFVRTDDYWGYFFDIHAQGKPALEAVGCSIPFPQQDVHLFKKN